MSLSTTTTTTYDLVKYSKAYNPSADSDSQTALEWQHFVNPVIRLTMDTKKSPDGRLETYRLKIIWVFVAGLNPMDLDQREVVFEDIDLVAYSTATSFQAPQHMPLKAVYQGPVVGLRYQFPRVISPGQTPQYRRFQIAFQNEAAATKFIDSIRFVCPCKPNTGPPARHPRPSQTLIRPPAPTSLESAPHIAMPMPVCGQPPSFQQTASIAVDEPPLQRTSTTPSISNLLNGSNWGAPRHNGENAISGASGAPLGHTNLASSRPSSAATVTSTVAHLSSSDVSGPALTLASVPAVATGSILAHASAPVPAFASVVSHARNMSSETGAVSATTGTATSQTQAPIRHHGSSSDIDTSIPSSSHTCPSSNANSSPPASRRLASSPVLMPPPPVPPQASLPHGSQPTSTPGAPRDTEVSHAAKARVESTITNNPRSDVIATLRDSAGLYDLSKEELAKLVGEVIREEGFVDLMRSLDNMWKIKGLAGVHT